ncbi:MAG: PilW family protein [Candidatus Binatia bacterium]
MMKIPKEFDSQGFTLMELVVATAISMVILGAIAGTFMTQTKFYNAQEQVNEMQQNARAAMDLMSREIKLAGYKPTGSAVIGVAYSASELRIRADLNGDGAINDTSDEHVVYTFDGANLQIKRAYGVVGATPEVLANSIAAFTFGYLNSSGAATTTPADIRQVSLNITARTAKPDPNHSSNNGYRTYGLSNVITPPNLAY